jgi:hypothetical protein
VINDLAFVLLVNFRYWKLPERVSTNRSGRGDRAEQIRAVRRRADRRRSRKDGSHSQVA